MSDQRNTIQAADFFHRLQYRGKTFHLHIVDTPGEKRSVFHQAANAVHSVYRGLNGAVVVFDVGDRFSYKNVASWIEAVQVSQVIDLVTTESSEHIRRHVGFFRVMID